MGRPAKETKEVATVEFNPPGTFLQEDAPTGSDDIGQEDVKIPRIKIAQNVHKGELPGDVEAGDFYNALTGENYGKKLILLILKAWKTRVKFNENFSVDCMSADAQHGSRHGSCNTCKFAEWVNGKPPICQQGYTYACLTSKDIEQGISQKIPKIPSLFTFAKSQIAAAKLINSNILIEKGNKRPSFAQSYILTAVEREFTKGKAFVIQAQPASYVNQDTFSYLKMINSIVEATDYKKQLSVDDVEGESDLPEETKKKEELVNDVFNPKKSAQKLFENQ